MPEERRDFFHQITGQEESGCKLFFSGWFGIVARCVTWLGKLWAVSVCWNASLISRASEFFVFVRMRRVTNFSLEVSELINFFGSFVDRFIVAFVSNRLKKTLAGKVPHWLKKKRIFLIVNIKLHFKRMDA